MQLQVQLVHTEGDRLVVLVTGWIGDQCLGSALGEAGNAEEAEDRAVARLRQRLAASTDQVQAPAPQTRQSPSTLPERGVSKEPSLPGGQPKPARTQGPASPFPAALSAKPAPGQPEPLATGALPAAAVQAGTPLDPGTKVEAGLSAGGMGPLSIGGTTSSPQPAPARSSPTIAGTASKPPADPEDWSDELAALEVQLQRLGWQREQESIYLQRAFGHPSRSRLTSYGDLVAYLNAVRQFQAPADPANVAVPPGRVELLALSDQLLSQLGWDAARGREILESHFQRSSRQQLNDDDLLRFNMILEGELITGAMYS